jgi:hypothetical protein
MSMMLRQCSRALVRSARSAAPASSRVCAAAALKIQRAGFATMYDNKPMPYEVRTTEAAAFWWCDEHALTALHRT